MEKQIDNLTQLGTDAVQSAISHYSQYFVLWSICWLAFGAVCAVVAVKVWKRREDWDDEVVGYLAVILLSLIALLTVPFNVPTLLQPRAYAIHQLIKDAR